MAREEYPEGVLADLVHSQRHLVICCKRCEPRRELRLTPWEACRIFGAGVTLRQAVKLARCDRCGARGADLTYPIEAYPCVKDLNAQIHVGDALDQLKKSPNDRFALDRLTEACANWEDIRPRPPATGEDVLMCIKYRFRSSLAETSRLFSDLQLPLQFPGGAPNLEAREEITLTERAPIVRMGAEAAELVMLTWSWKGPTGKAVFNFRSEGRRFAAADRLLILADGFYEFLPIPEGAPSKSRKPRILFERPDQEVFALAGYSQPADHETFTMLTTGPGPDVSPYHSRQPVVLPQWRWRDWLSGAPEPALLAPSPPGTLIVRNPG